jgi:twitching motility protein PilU
VRDLIHKGEIHAIKEAMEKSENVGMQTFDSHLLRLFKEGTISLEEALQNSDSPNNLKLKINLSDGLGSVSPDKAAESSKNDLLAGLSLQAIHKEDEEPESQH